MDSMPTEPNHYLCSRCGSIWRSYAAIDRTREVRCTSCCDGAWWDDETLNARLGGMIA